jgi:hypothetical protein
MVALSVAALFAILIFVAGADGELEGRLLATTLIVAIFSLTGLCASVAFEHRRSLVLGAAGVTSSGLAALLAVVVVWSDVSQLFEGTLLLRLAFASGIAAAALAWCSLVLLSARRYPSTRVIVQTTVSLVLLIGAIFDVVIVAELSLPGGFWRFVGILAVLAVLGTFLAPIQTRVLSIGESTEKDQTVSPPAG